MTSGSTPGATGPATTDPDAGTDICSPEWYGLTMRRSVVVVAVLLAMATLFFGGTSLVLSPSVGDGDAGGLDSAPESDTISEKRQAEMISPREGESTFWPYLSHRKGFNKRSPVNVVVVGETDQVMRALTERGDGDWEETDEAEREAGSDTYSLVGSNASDGNATAPRNGTNATASGATGSNPPNGTVGPNGTVTPNATNGSGDPRRFDAATVVGWGDTSGATRYAYLDPGPNESGRWVTETAQLDDGTYYGQRYHIRLYENPGEDDWVIMQTHSEHFDWFTLRHRVAGSQEAQTHLERDLMALPTVDQQRDVRRVYLDNRNNNDADGWATFVDLTAAVVLAAAVLPISQRRLRDLFADLWDGLAPVDRERLLAARERADLRHAVLSGLIVALVLGVRWAGIALERVGTLSMHGIAALLYPVLALGLPVGTYLVARGLERRLDAAVVAGTAFAVAVWLDYGTIGVTTIPIEVIVQRAYMMVALGLVAAGAACRASRERNLDGLLLVGVALWVSVLAGTLLGYL